MTRILLVTLLLLGTAGANAATWPWEDTPEEPLDYCTGLVVGGLASYQVAGVSRTDLWLAWSYLIRSGALSETESAGFQSGRQLFGDDMNAGAALAVVEDADGSCGLGRSGHQIVGW